MFLLGLTDSGEHVHLDKPFLHSFCLGYPGMGKTALMKNVLFQAMRDGWGVIVLDPAGDLADALGFIPRYRLKDVQLIDREHVTVYNPLDLPYEYEGKRDNELIVMQFTRALTKLVELQSPDQHTTVNMQKVLRRCLLPMLERNDRDLMHLLHALETYKGGEEDKATALRVAARLDTLLGLEATRRFFLGDNQLDIARVAHEGKILLVDGRGMHDAFTLIGTLITNEIIHYIENERLQKTKKVLLLVDEFHRICNDDFATIFAEARKSKVACFLAMQNLHQVAGGIAAERLVLSIKGAAYNLITFKVPFFESQKLAEDMKDVEPEDIRELDPYHCYVRVSGKTYKLKTVPPPPKIKAIEAHLAQHLSAHHTHDYFYEGWFD